MFGHASPGAKQGTPFVYNMYTYTTMQCTFLLGLCGCVGIYICIEQKSKWSIESFGSECVCMIVS